MGHVARPAWLWRYEFSEYPRSLLQQGNERASCGAVAVSPVYFAEIVPVLARVNPGGLSIARHSCCRADLPIPAGADIDRGRAMHTPYFSTNLSIANARMRVATADGVVSARITASTSFLFTSFCQSLRRTSSCSADSSFVACADRRRVVVPGTSLQQHARQSQVCAWKASTSTPPRTAAAVAMVPWPPSGGVRVRRAHRHAQRASMA